MKFLLKTKNDAGALLARLTLGGVMFPHGAQKALGMFGGDGIAKTVDGFGTGLGIPAALAYCAIAAEFLGSIALVLGFMGRLAALGIGVTMAVAIQKVHLQNGFFMSDGGYEFHLLAIGLALVVLVKGSGAASVDRMIAKE